MCASAIILYLTCSALMLVNIMSIASSIRLRLTCLMLVFSSYVFYKMLVFRHLLVRLWPCRLSALSSVFKFLLLV